MIETFKSKELAKLWAGQRTKIDGRLHRRILARLDALDAASVPEDMHVPGFNFHGLQGFQPKRYTVHVNGPWCITFAFDGGSAFDVDLENYH